jgi:tRNA 2-thiouridine synthesizing protein A
LPDQDKPKQTLDCVGLYCPEPLFKTRENIDEIEIGEVLEVITDDPAAEEDITRFAKRAGHTVIKLEKFKDHMRFLIKRGK